MWVIGEVQGGGELKFKWKYFQNESEQKIVLEILAQNVQDYALLEALALVGGLKCTKCDKKEH